MNHLKPYPTYKDSGVPWLGKVPEHWEMFRGKSIFQCVDVRSSTGKEELLTVSSERGVIPRKSANVTMFKAENYAGYKLCWPGDLVINTLWAWARGLGVSRHHGIVSSAYGVYRLRPKCEANVNFIHELMRSSPFQWELQVRSKGVWISRLQLTDESFLSAPIGLPPLLEQNAIVCYLDYMNKRMRRYINAKKKLIALLNEQKQAIINHAVTRGLDPHVRLKPSGVEWLGDIPEHWEVRRLKYSAKLIMGQSPSSDTYSLERTGLPFLQGCAEFGIANPNAKYFCHSPAKISPKDAILMSVRAPIGRLNVADQKYGIGRGLCAIIPRSSILDMNFALYELEIVVPGLFRVATGSTYDAVSTGDVGSLFISIPPISEQTTIVRFLNGAVANLDTATNRAQREIDLLREYRTRLIADGVTGKLDVREAAVSLPEEAEQPEDIEELTDSEGMPEEVALEPAIAEAIDED